MALNAKQYDQIREEIEKSDRPLIFFHDDADGLSSFLLLYRHIMKGKGIMVKPLPIVDEKYLHYVEEYSPDRIFVVDIAVVEQEFIDRAGKPVVWIDHHTPLKRKNVLYFNPRSSELSDSEPVSYVCYKALKRDLWIAMTGAIGDWYMPDFAGEFAEKYPDLFDAKIKKPEEALFTTKIGELVKVFSFILKGASEEAMKCVRILQKVESPYEIISSETPRGKFVYKRYDYFRKLYDALMEKAKKAAAKGNFLVYIYRDKDSFTGDMSNELLFLHPDKVVIVGREKQGEVRMSLRGAGKNKVLPKLKKALEGMDGYGGGHEYACGATVKKKDFDSFIDKLREEF
ncbi:hypothetical protein JXB11_02200 [Candidatus Woesearchaeota archaeon]|nr:hypothetical protein [Candidatus Woesearchaeota archaeon]